MFLSKFMQPRKGSLIQLQCTACKHSFLGRNPKGNNFFDDLTIKIKPVKCPKCCSSKIIPHPAFLY